MLKKIILVSFIMLSSMAMSVCFAGHSSDCNAYPSVKTVKQQLFLHIINDSIHFRINRFRLIKIAQYQDQIEAKHQSLTAIQYARKERYVTDRDKYRDRLDTDLEIARILFGGKIAKAVTEYEKMERKDSGLTDTQTYGDNLFKDKLNNIILLVYNQSK